MVLERCNLVHRIAERIVNTMVQVRWRYISYVIYYAIHDNLFFGTELFEDMYTHKVTGDYILMFCSFLFKSGR